MAGRSALDLSAQAPGFYRSFGMVAQVLPAILDSVRKYTSQAQDALRIGFSIHYSGKMARRFREDLHPRRCPTTDTQGKRHPIARRRSLKMMKLTIPADAPDYPTILHALEDVVRSTPD